MNQLKGRLDQTRAEAESIEIKKTPALGIWLDSERSPKRWVFEAEAGTLHLGPESLLLLPALAIASDDRIALRGPNGAGKSTLVRKIIQQIRLPGDRLTYVPQEIPRVRGKEILEDIRSLPSGELGQVMTVVSRLGSSPERLLDSVDPSPGETRKLLLARGIVRRPYLIVMDEPTNHLDLPSIECVEGALSDCPCALLLVSHDERFLDSLTSRTWRISPSGSDYELAIEY